MFTASVYFSLGKIQWRWVCGWMDGWVTLSI